MEYVLASASPRRKELLAQILSKFEVIPSAADEKVNISLFPEQMACALAESKCDAVFALNPNKTVIGCDTIVVFGNEILGKPRDKTDAVKTLKMLSGKTHYVITGVCVRNKFKKSVDFDRTEVKVNILTDEFIESYVNGGRFAYGQGGQLWHSGRRHSKGVLRQLHKRSRSARYAYKKTD